MINLVPNNEKKIMKKDFYLRLIVMFFFMFGFCILITSILLVPSYYVSSLKKRNALDNLEYLRSFSLPSLAQDSMNDIQELNAKLALFEKAQKEKFFVSFNVLDLVLLKKIPGIKITQMSFNTDIQGGKSLDLKGVSNTREDLLIFKKNLEDNGVFSSVNLPISNFVKTSNIQFSINLSLKNEKNTSN